jgi:hypothetical protein
MDRKEIKEIVMDKNLTDKDKKTIIMSDFIGDYFNVMLESPLIKIVILGYYLYTKGYFDEIKKLGEK